MQPETREEKRNKEFLPKWRHFHPGSTLILKNPFPEAIQFQVADEFNVPHQYVLPANAECELPGGAVATLGLKAIVDKMIGENGDDLIRIWSQPVRKKYEDKIIIDVIDPPELTRQNDQGVIDLGTKKQESAGKSSTKAKQEEPAFPAARRPAKPAPGTGQTFTPDPNLATIASQSVGNEDQLIEED